MGNITETSHFERLQDEEDVFTECCGEPFAIPGYPDSDLCSFCGEHTGPIEDDEEEEKKHIIVKDKDWFRGKWVSPRDPGDENGK